MRTLHAFVFFLLAGVHLYAAPAWVEDFGSEDAAFKYFLGRSEAANEAQAVNTATQDAISQAVRLFGIQSQVNTEAYEDLSKTSSTTRIQEISSRVKLIGFEQVRVQTEKESKRIQAWALYRYPKSEYEKEKLRLAKSPEKESKIEFSTQGEAASSSSGILEIVSNPNGAEIRIDNQVYGRSPLRLVGQLSEGVHKLTIDRKEYEPTNEDVVIVPGKTQRVEKTLMKASELLTVNTSPPNSFVVLDGKPLGLSPVETRVEVGKDLQLTLSHAEAETTSKVIQVERGASRVLNEQLPLKPAYVSLSAETHGAILEVGGKTTMLPVSKLQLDAGTYKAQISRDGFVPKEIKFTVHGGEVLDLGSVQLTSLSDEEKRLLHFPWLIGINFGAGNSSLSERSRILSRFGLNFEKRFYGFVGAKVEAAYLYGFSSEKDKKAKGFEFSGSVPFFFRRFSIAPEVGWSSITYEQDIKTPNILGNLQTTGHESISVKQVFYGANIGYEFWQSKDAQKASGIHFSVRKYSESKGFDGAWTFTGLIGGEFRF